MANGPGRIPVEQVPAVAPAKLPDWTSLGPTRIPNSGGIADFRIQPINMARFQQPTANVGRSVANFGGAISDVGNQLYELQVKQQDFQTEASFQQFEFDQMKALQEAQRSMPLDQAGSFADTWQRQYIDNAKQFFKNVPEPLKAKFGNRLLNTEMHLYGQAQKFGLQSQNLHAANTVDEAVKNIYGPMAYGAEEKDMPGIIDRARTLIDGNQFWTAIQKEEAKIKAEQAIRGYFANGQIDKNPAGSFDAIDKAIKQKEKTSGSLLDSIKGFEGFQPTAKWDYKQYTNGYGTKAASPNETIDKATAERRLVAEVSRANEIVDSVNPDLPSGVKRALTSLTFNAGDEWTRQGLGESIRNGDLATAKQQFLQYNHAGGAVNMGLVKRRAAEANWFDSGSNVDLSAQATQGDYLSTMPLDQLLKMRSRAEQQRRAQLVDMERAQTIRRRQINEASDTRSMEIIRDVTGNNPTITTQDVLRDPSLTTADAIKLPGIIEKLQQEIRTPPAVSHSTAVNLIQDINRDPADPQRINDKSAIIDAFTQNKLNKEDFNFVMTQFQKRDNDFEKTKTRFYKDIQPKIDRSNPVAGLIYPGDKSSFYQYQWDIEKKVQGYLKEGKDPSELFDPHSKTYVGSPEALLPYQKTLNQSLTEQLQMITPPAGAGSAVVRPPSTTPRLPGESVQDYLKRTGR